MSLLCTFGIHDLPPGPGSVNVPTLCARCRQGFVWGYYGVGWHPRDSSNESVRGDNWEDQWYGSPADAEKYRRWKSRGGTHGGGE